MSLPLISIILPVFNREHCVRASVDSVLAQTCRDFELIVVDDGSTDGSRKILESYGDNISLLVQKNSGAGSARNAGLRAARGKWIAFLDSDDAWHPEKLATQMRLLAQYGGQFCFSRCVGENGELLPDIEDVTATLKEPGVYHVADPVEFCSRARCHPYLQSTVVEKSLFEATGFFDTSLHTGDDTLWIFRLCHLGGCLYVDRPLTTIFRGSDNSLTYDVRSAAMEKRWDAFIRTQAEMYWRLRQTRPAQTALTRGRLGYALSRRAELACAAGNVQLTRSLASDALPFVTGTRNFLRAAALWLAPQLLHPHFQKKWPRV